MTTAFIGAENGVYHLDGDSLTPLGLDEHRISAILAWRNGGTDYTILAGSYESGMFRSTDSGASWQPANEGLTAPCIRTIQHDPTTSGGILCGTEPARAYITTDGGASWWEFTSLKELATCPDWYLPYSPRAGAIRNFYSPPDEPLRLLGAIEVGGLLSSEDKGGAWELLNTQPDDDIHYITGHPTENDVLFAALGWASMTRGRRREDEPQLGGVGRSDDGGKTWRKFFSDYTRAVIVPPARPDLVLAAPALRVGQQGRIDVSADGGESWQPASGGLATPMEDMVEIFMPAPDGEICAVCSGGRLLQAAPGEWQWRALLPAGSDVRAESISFI